jgi:large subunit ribosomal protein L4
VLSQKFADGKMLFIDALTFTAPKTAAAKAFLRALSGVENARDLSTKKTNAALIVLPGRDQGAEMSFRNMGNVHVVAAKDLNPVDALTYKYVVVAKPTEALKTLESRVSTKSARKATSVTA